MRQLKFGGRMTTKDCLEYLTHTRRVTGKRTIESKLFTDFLIWIKKEVPQIEMKILNKESNKSQEVVESHNRLHAEERKMTRSICVIQNCINLSGPKRC